LPERTSAGHASLVLIKQLQCLANNVCVDRNSKRRFPGFLSNSFRPETDQVRFPTLTGFRKYRCATIAGVCRGVNEKFFRVPSPMAPASVFMANKWLFPVRRAVRELRDTVQILLGQFAARIPKLPLMFRKLDRSPAISPQVLKHLCQIVASDTQK
jgi:hypothetical protein